MVQAGGEGAEGKCEGRGEANCVCLCALRRSCAQCVAAAVAEALLFVIFVAAAA